MAKTRRKNLGGRGERIAVVAAAKMKSESECPRERVGRLQGIMAGLHHFFVPGFIECLRKTPLSPSRFGKTPKAERSDSGLHEIMAQLLKQVRRLSPWMSPKTLNSCLLDSSN